MIVIKNVEVIEVPDHDRAVIEYFTAQPVNEGCSVALPFVKEMVQGRIYINAKGEEVCIGMARKVQDTIGLPFGALENLRRRCESLERQNKSLWDDLRDVRAKLLQYKSMGFWGRLKFLFTGKIKETS